MFNFFKKKKTAEASESGAAGEEALNEFYQYFVDRFVYLVDTWRDENPNGDPLLNDWQFKLEDAEWGDVGIDQKRVSCRIIAHDQAGVFPAFGEYAHGFGADYSAAIDAAFNNWMETDLPVIADLKSDKSIFCDQFSKKGVLERGLMGPMQFWSAGGNGPQPCCNSCIFTQTLLADETILTRKKPMMIKAVVCRNPDNSTQTDFRINEVQDEKIAAKLSEWATSWEGDGFAMRKQCLVLT